MKTTVEITLIEGHMGTGKTTTGVAQIVDAYHADPTIHIFSNVHLYGIKYVYNPDIESTLELLDHSSFNEGWWLIDEAYIGGDAMRSGSAESLLYSWIMQQMRKRKLKVIWIVQNDRMMTWRIKWGVTRKIICLDYDWDEEKQKGTRKIKCTIKDIMKSTVKTVRYYAPQYWRYYNTDELPNIPIRRCACGCNKILLAAGNYLPGHYAAKRDADKLLKEAAKSA